MFPWDGFRCIVIWRFLRLAEISVTEKYSYSILIYIIGDCVRQISGSTVDFLYGNPQIYLNFRRTGPELAWLLEMGRSVVLVKLLINNRFGLAFPLTSTDSHFDLCTVEYDDILSCTWRSVQSVSAAWKRCLCPSLTWRHAASLKHLFSFASCEPCPCIPLSSLPATQRGQASCHLLPISRAATKALRCYHPTCSCHPATYSAQHGQKKEIVERFIQAAIAMRAWKAPVSLPCPQNGKGDLLIPQLLFLSFVLPDSLRGFVSHPWWFSMSLMSLSPDAPRPKRLRQTAVDELMYFFKN